MIEITIKQTMWTTKKVQKNMLVKKTPTDVVKVTNTKNTYSSDRQDIEPQFIEEYAVGDVDETTSREYTLLKQEIPLEKEGTFDLARVIKAINGLGS
jgi:hypothetical protein